MRGVMWTYILCCCAASFYVANGPDFSPCVDDSAWWFVTEIWICLVVVYKIVCEPKDIEIGVGQPGRVALWA